MAALARFRRPAPVLFVAAILAAPGLLMAQGPPVGPEFRVNSYTTWHQSLPAVASDSAGNFVVVWHGYAGTSINDYGIFAQRFASTGGPLGGEFRVNTYTTQQQRYPAVASDSAGNFVAVWQSLFQFANDYGVFAQRYASTGAPIGPEFRVNTYTTANKLYPRVASDAAGNFVVAWTSYYQDGFNFGIYAQRFASTGAPLGGEFRVNTFLPFNQRFPAVASDSTGNFVVAWQSYAQDGSGEGIYAQRFASTGAPLGGEFRVNTYVAAHQLSPAVACDPAGNFVVVWDELGGSAGVFAQRYQNTGAPLGGQFQVNTDVTNFARYASVAFDPSGDFVVVWQNGPTSPDGSGYGVFGQRYASTGTPLGGEFRVNTYTTHNQRFPSVAADSTGRFVVIWESYFQDGEFGGIYGQRYSMIVPVELVGFTID